MVRCSDRDGIDSKRPSSTTLSAAATNDCALKRTRIYRVRWIQTALVVREPQQNSMRAASVRPSAPFLSAAGQSGTIQDAGHFV